MSDSSSQFESRSGPLSSRGASSVLVLVSMISVGVLTSFGWWMVGSDPSPRPSDDELLELRLELRRLSDKVDRLERERRPAALEGFSVKLEEDESEAPMREILTPEKTAASDQKTKEKKVKKRGSDWERATAEMREIALIADINERRKAAQELIDSLEFWPRGEAIKAMMAFDPEAALEATHQFVEVAAEEPKGAWGAIGLVESLGEIEGYPVAQDLYQLYDSELWGVSITSARALERQGDSTLIDREIDRLFRDIRSADYERRLEAISNLAHTQSARAVPHLIPWLSDSNWETRVRALESFAAVGDSSHIGEIEGLLNDPIAAVRDRALETIRALRSGRREFGK